MTEATLKIRGRVQGVGFRPFIYRLAQSIGVNGSVHNDLQGVVVRLNASEDAIHRFKCELRKAAPAAAIIESIVCSSVNDTETPAKGFSISRSSMDVTREPASVADLALCEQCLNELFDSDNRRYLHPFISCAECGPRYSILRTLPYDRLRTSMATFTPCQACDAEYNDATERRFHAQTLSCHDCGPHYRFVDEMCDSYSEQGSFEAAANLIAAGKVLALKGIGGFHLVCDARNPDAVERLRDRKQRPVKPLAVMAVNEPSIQKWVHLDSDNMPCSSFTVAPVTLFPKRDCEESELHGIAPGVADLGVMLPYTAAHYLLFHALLGQPHGTDWLRQAQRALLVVTSANLSGSPLISDNESSLNKLRGIADGFLIHDRDIVAPCDDSVVQGGQHPIVIRRARGMAPEPVSLPYSISSTLALGAFLKNSFCYTAGKKAYLSPYIGDLDGVENCQHLERVLEHYQYHFKFSPEVIACDLHPDFYSTRLAEKLSSEWQVPLVKVQHHRAHVAAVMAEHGIKGPVIGLALDGTGLGDDGHAWGGEMLCGELHSLTRLGHFSPLPMPGGDRAARESWRLGIAALQALDKSLWPAHFESYANDPLFESLLKNSGLSPKTSSAGRWFDAIASILGVRQEQAFEAQAAMELEALASLYPVLPQAGQLITIGASGQLNLYPLIEPLLGMDDPRLAAARFHAELIDALVRWVEWAHARQASRQVVCAGGCFQNRLLRQGLAESAARKGFDVYFSNTTPLNDGGISLGQSWLAGHLNAL